MTDMGPGTEFDLIRELAKRWGSAAAGIGDDAAVLDLPRGEKLVASTDVAIENVHFKWQWLSLRQIGYRATAAALSDLAAMAATPRGILVSLTVDAGKRDALLELADGIGDAVRAAGTLVLGGNLARADALSITTTVLGSCFAPLSRAGIRPGDVLYVTGALGAPRAAVRSLEAGRMPEANVQARFVHPEARLAEARWLASRGAVACIDISDGLVSDAAHLAAASGVQLDIEVERVPVFSGATEEEALAGGEEYELLVAAREPLDEAQFAREFGIALTAIGRAIAQTPGVAFTLNGRRVAVPRGYDHFSP